MFFIFFSGVFYRKAIFFVWLIFFSAISSIIPPYIKTTIVNSRIFMRSFNIKPDKIALSRKFIIKESGVDCFRLPDELKKCIKITTDTIAKTSLTIINP